MSQNLYYRVVEPKKARTLGDGLKWALQKKYGHGPATLTNADLPFLEGVKAAQFKEDSDVACDCQTLIDLVIQSDYGVEIWIAE